MDADIGTGSLFSHLGETGIGFSSTTTAGHMRTRQLQAQAIAFLTASSIFSFAKDARILLCVKAYAASTSWYAIL